MVGIAQLVSASGCGPEGRGFESHYSPHIDSNLGLTESKGYRQDPATPARNDSLAQQVEHRTFNAMVRSSNLRWVTRKRARQVLFFFIPTEICLRSKHSFGENSGQVRTDADCVRRKASCANRCTQSALFLFPDKFTADGDDLWIIDNPTIENTGTTKRTKSKHLYSYRSALLDLR